jgi:hypothetical protein
MTKEEFNRLKIKDIIRNKYTRIEYTITRIDDHGNVYAYNSFAEEPEIITSCYGHWELVHAKTRYIPPNEFNIPISILEEDIEKRIKKKKSFYGNNFITGCIRGLLFLPAFLVVTFIYIFKELIFLVNNIPKLFEK